jgi:hypothetical protein
MLRAFIKFAVITGSLLVSFYGIIALVNLLMNFSIV